MLQLILRLWHVAVVLRGLPLVVAFILDIRMLLAVLVLLLDLLCLQQAADGKISGICCVSGIHAYHFRILLPHHRLSWIPLHTLLCA
jgi:hypothetical protein